MGDSNLVNKGNVLIKQQRVGHLGILRAEVPKGSRESMGTCVEVARQGMSDKQASRQLFRREMQVGEEGRGGGRRRSSVGRSDFLHIRRSGHSGRQSVCVPIIQPGGREGGSIKVS
jgi:hypothetical protein